MNGAEAMMQPLWIDLARIIFEEGKESAARFLIERCGVESSRYRAFSNMAHLLLGLDSLNDVAATLYSRLVAYPEFREDCQALASVMEGPYLVPVHHLPDSPHPALRLTLSGHTDDVTGCAVSPDGTFVVSSSRDETLKLWDMTSGLEIRTLQGHKDWVTSCAISPDGKTIISASQDGTIRLWDVATGRENLRVKRHKWYKNPCAIGQTYIIAATEDGTIRVSEAHSGGRLFTLPSHGERSQITHVATDDKIIVASSNDTAIHIWDINTQTEILTLRGHKRRVNVCAIGPETIVSASLDETVKVWDRFTGEELMTLTGHHGEVTTCAIDGERIVSASWDGVIKVWNLLTGAERATFTGHTHRINDCALHGNTIVSASSDGTIRLWDVLVTGHPVREAGENRCCAISADGRWAASGTNLGTITLWDMKSGEAMHTFHDPTDRLTCCAVEGDNLIYGLDHRVKGWDAAQFSEVFNVELPNEATITACAADRGVIVTGWSDGTLRFLASDDPGEPPTIRRELKGHQGSIEGVAFRDKTIVSVSVDKSLRLWAYGESQPITLRGDTDILRCCAFRDDTIAAGSRDGQLLVWHRATGTLRYPPILHRDDIRGVTISADASLIVSVTRDGTLNVWDAVSGNHLTTLAVSGRLYACAIRESCIMAAGSSGIYFFDLRR
jgi:WD40 repeat protein